MSNFFPKYSPDGKWIVFCKAKSYMLLQPDSELYIIPAAGGVARRLRYNTARMNSWHSWSSNSRWLVFSSKVNTPYTQLFLTHIDENGNDSPPVLLERFTSPDRAANIPEFVKLPGDAIADIREQFLDPYSFLRAGMANEHTGDHKGAERAYRRGLEIAPDDAELHNALGWTLFQDGRTAEAVAEYERALAANPNHAKSHNNLALALVELGRLEEAASHFKTSLALEPKAEIYSDLGFTMARLGKSEEALADYQKALELDPNCASAHFNLAVTFVQAGKFGGGRVPLPPGAPRKAHRRDPQRLGIRSRPTGPCGRGGRGVSQGDRRRPEIHARLQQPRRGAGEAGEARRSGAVLRRSLAEKPSAAVYNALGVVLRKLGKTDEAADQFGKASVGFGSVR